MTNTDKLFATLASQLESAKATEKQMRHRLIATAVILAPLYSEHVGKRPGYGSLGMRALLAEIKSGSGNIHDAIEILDSTDDWNHSEVIDFCLVAQMLAGITLCSEDENDWWVRYYKCSGKNACEKCARSYMLKSLTETVLETGWSENLCLETGHAPDWLFEEITNSLLTECDLLLEDGPRCSFRRH